MKYSVVLVDSAQQETWEIRLAALLQMRQVKNRSLAEVSVAKKHIVKAEFVKLLHQPLQKRRLLHLNGLQQRLQV